MYVCTNCGAEFETPKQYREMVPGEPLPFDVWVGCPVCAGDYITRRVCDCCGNVILTDYYYRVGDGVYCENCVDRRENYD